MSRTIASINGPTTESERQLARESSDRLARHIDVEKQMELQIVENGKSTESVSIPGSVAQLLSQILGEIAQGHSVALVPHRPEMSTQEAADYLNVSRPYFVGLLESGAIPCRKVGNRRRVLLIDVVEFKKKNDAARLKVLDELVAQAQELNMGY